jgi:hypothetical protein
MDVVDCPNLAQKMAEGTLRKAARSALTCSSPEAAVKMTTVCVLMSARFYECPLLRVRVLTSARSYECPLLRVPILTSARSYECA